MHQNRSNTPSLTQFDHIHFRPALAEKCIPDLRVRLKSLIQELERPADQGVRGGEPEAG